MITQIQIMEIANIIANSYQPEKIILFGSYATDMANEESDLDLLIIKNSDLPRTKRNFEIWKQLRKKKYMFPIDIMVYTNDEIQKDINNKFSFVYNVFKDGKIIYTKN